MEAGSPLVAQVLELPAVVRHEVADSNNSDGNVDGRLGDEPRHGSASDVLDDQGGAAQGLGQRSALVREACDPLLGVVDQVDRPAPHMPP